MKHIKSIFQAVVLPSMMMVSALSASSQAVHAKQDNIVVAEAVSDRVDTVKPESKSGIDVAAWRAWKSELKREVVAKGIPQAFADSIFPTIEFEPDAVKYDLKQFTRQPFQKTIKRNVSDYRIQKGVDFYKKHKVEIDRFADKYEVSPFVMVALLGMETNYGTYLGNYDVLGAAASIAFASKRKTEKAQKKRRDYFRSQVFHALKILNDGLVAREDFKGSWAAAFGVNQHMPESFYTYVIDGDRDGDREILNVNDLSDVFATTANHLHEVGFKDGFRWGRYVQLPASGVSDSQIGHKKKRTLYEWKNMGVTTQNGHALPVVAGMKGAIIQPYGMSGRDAILVYDNFFAFKRWNNSSSFSVSVGRLSEEISRLSR